MRLEQVVAPLDAALLPPPAEKRPAAKPPERGEESKASLPAPVERFYTSREVDERAVPINEVDLDYPEQAYAQQLSGTVVLRLLIDRRGAVREATVVDSEPKGVFDEAALRAARGLRFQPALRAGVAVGSIKTIEVPFYPNCNRTGSCPK